MIFLCICEIPFYLQPIQYFFNAANIVRGHKIVLFKSLRNSKRHNKGNFMLKSNLNNIKLCGGGGQHYLVLNKSPTL